MKKIKIVLIIVAIIAVIWSIIFSIDYSRVKINKLPIFCIEAAHVADGGTTIYTGLGYKVINYNVKKYSDGIIYKGIFIGTWFMKYEDHEKDLEKVKLETTSNEKTNDNDIIITDSPNIKNVISSNKDLQTNVEIVEKKLVPQAPTAEQLKNGEVDIKEYKENLKNRSIDNVTLKVKEDTITRTGATFILTDKNKAFCSYGAEYRIEVYKDGKWKMKKPITDGFTWEAISMRPGAEVSELKKDWSRFYGELPNGKYRIGISVCISETCGFVYAEFNIK